MAKVENVSGCAVVVGPEAWIPGGRQIVIPAGSEYTLFNSDFNRSVGFKYAVQCGALHVVNMSQPGDGGPVPNASVGYGGVSTQSSEPKDYRDSEAYYIALRTEIEHNDLKAQVRVLEDELAMIKETLSKPKWWQIWKMTGEHK